MRSNRTGGFTLIELLIVIAIIGILAAVLIPNLMNARRVAVDRAAQGMAQNVYTAANAYLAEHVAADAAAVVALDGTCGDGVTYGAYSVSAPSFTTSVCTVTVGADGDFVIDITYSGGVTGVSPIQFP